MSYTIKTSKLVKDPKKGKDDGRYFKEGDTVTRNALEALGANVDALLAGGVIVDPKAKDADAK